MAKSKNRILLPTENVGGIMVAGRCSQCFRPFEVQIAEGESAAVTESRLAGVFNAHVCDEDANQTTARIVGETTE